MRPGFCILPRPAPIVFAMNQYLFVSRTQIWYNPWEEKAMNRNDRRNDINVIHPGVRSQSMNEDIRIDKESAGSINNADVRSSIPEEMEGNDAAPAAMDEKTIRKMYEIQRSIDEHTEQRAQIVQEMLREKEKPPSLIKSIVDRISGE